MKNYIKILPILVLLLFSGCSSDAIINPICHEKQKLAIVETVLFHYLENEAALSDKFMVQSLNVYFIEQNVPWWRFGRPSEGMIDRLQKHFERYFLIYTKRAAVSEDVYYGDDLVDSGLKDPVTGKSGDVISVDRISWSGNLNTEVEFRVWSGKLSSVTYQAVLTHSESAWTVEELLVKVE